jgi:hypothetical protein
MFSSGASQYAPGRIASIDFRAGTRQGRKQSEKGFAKEAKIGKQTVIAKSNTSRRNQTGKETV